MLKLSTIALCAALAGCASTHMAQYVGKDIREVMLDEGPPIHALDLGDGSRAFQYPFGGGTFTTPTVTTNSGSVSRFGNQAWLQSTAITSGGTFTAPPCIVSYITRWDAGRAGWVVTEFRAPKALVC